MTTKGDGDRLLRAAVTVLSTPGWGTWERKLKPLADVVEEVAPGRVERARTTVKNKARASREAARWEGDPPLWAKNLMTKYASTFKLQWRRSQINGHSTGRTFGWSSRIVVTAGADVGYQKATLLHEIAHARTPGVRHGDAFWDELYRLARAENHVEITRASDSRSFVTAMRRARRKDPQP